MKGKILGYVVVLLTLLSSCAPKMAPGSSETASYQGGQGTGTESGNTEQSAGKTPTMSTTEGLKDNTPAAGDYLKQYTEQEKK